MKKVWLLITTILLLAFSSYLIKIAYASNSSSDGITIIGKKTDTAAQQLYDTAVKHAPKTYEIIWADTGKDKAKYKKILEKYPTHNRAAAYVCAEHKCSLPAFTPNELIKLIDYFSKNTATVTTKSSASMLDDYQANIQNLLGQGKWWVVVAVFWLIGLMLALTPCVLPLLIIITSLMAGHADTLTRRKAVSLSLIYILSLACTYALVGIAAAMFGVYLQGYMQNTYIIIVFSLIFLFLGISTLGIFRFQLPKSVRMSLSYYNKTHGGSYVGAMLMGMLATLIASPCVAAPLAGVLAYVATSGNLQLGGIALFSMGLGIGTPLIIIVTIGSELLQKTGHVQKYVKQLFGVILIGISIWLVSRILHPQIVMLLWASLAIATAIYTGAISMMRRQDLHEAIESSASHRLIQSFFKTISIMILIYGGTLIFGASMGNSNPLAPLGKKMPTTKVAAVEMLSFTNINNEQQFTAALSASKRNHKPALVFFTASWCSACKEIKNDIFTEVEVKNLMADFTLIMIDLSDSAAQTVILARNFNVIGPPAIILFDKNGEQASLRFYSKMNTNQLISALKKVLNKINLQIDVN